jgi:hypothetical protein
MSVHDFINAVWEVVMLIFTLPKICEVESQLFAGLSAQVFLRMPPL